MEGEKKEKQETFPKIIHLPIELKSDLEVMAIRTGNGDLKNMIQRQTISQLAKWKLEDKD